MQQVLIVEDDDAFAQAIARVARELGLRPIVAGDADTAWQFCLEELPDFVLLDIRLPGDDGYDLACRLRTEADFRGRIISFSAYPPDRIRQAEAGIYFHLAKPFDLDTVRAFLRSL